MNGRRTKQLRKLYWQTDAQRFNLTFRAWRRQPPVAKLFRTPLQPIPAADTRDKTNWAHGKMKRAGYYATRKRA